MGVSVDLSITNAVIFGGILFLGKKLLQLLQQWKVNRMLRKWDNAPRNKVILHTLWRGRTLPGLSPFALKLETYLRLAKIPYELDFEDGFGPKGKLPWITYNGEHIADSQLCIQFLNKKLSVNLNKRTTPEKLANATACRIVLEDHFFWGLVQHRLIDNQNSLFQSLKMNPLFRLFIPIQTYRMKARMDGQGLGKHSPSEIYQMTEQDLHVVAGVLGSQKFFGGDEPCEEDCAIFGMLAQAAWALQGSSFERLVNGELKTLKAYCERMKDYCWADWENSLDKS